VTYMDDVKMSDEQEWAVRVFRAALNIATDEQRVAMLHAAESGYCTSCGIDDPRCQCDNDE
jgi:hypothetical protein